MKIRINNNSLRIRLSKSEVSTLATEGTLDNKINFGTGVLKYILSQSAVDKQLVATFSNDSIVVSIPDSFALDWPNNNIIGLDGDQPISETETLYILVEKDFKCIDNSTEDQSDNYENPKAC